tara:strand:+ start:533 stop:1525 length:993 start_codon:yes stop_codon:yes gene_type:complete
MTRTHGGPDARGPARFDFSTNANAAGPCPMALAAVQAADASRYPDPGYTALRAQLAAFHGVAPQRILLAASASEFIQRITAVGARLQPGPVQVPVLAYGDYRAAAQAWGREGVTADDPRATLRWQAEPGSPLGQDAPPPADPGDRPTVLDAVYAPLRLQGQGAWTPTQRDQVFVMHSPNKGLGLCGVRGAYVVAPDAAAGLAWDVAAWCQALQAAEASWLLSAQGVAMLHSWTEEGTQQWLRESLRVLRGLKAALAQLLAAHGFELQPSVTPFFVARPPMGLQAAALREAGIAVRNATSFGLPGCWRLSAQPGDAMQALATSMDKWQAAC